MTHARSRFLWSTFATIAIVVGTAIAILFANGYRPTRNGKLVAGNGLLVVNSEPKGARVSVNGRFLTATDDTLYLDPDQYEVEMHKDGYFPWKKTLQIEQEVVTQANALLFPVAPSLSPLTLSGALKPVPSPDGQKLAYYTASSSAQTKNGYYVTELADNPLAFQRGPRQITRTSNFFPIDTTKVLWSPDSTQILMISPHKAVILDPSRLNEVDTMRDVTFQLPTILSQWEEEMYRRDRERLLKFPLEVQRVATHSAVNVYFSPDEEKLMYTAVEVFTLPETLIPPKPGSSTQPQERTVEIGGIYVYDRDEDRQFRIGTDDQYLSWIKEQSTEASAESPNRTRNSPTPAAPSPAPFNPQKRLLSDDLFRRSPLSLEASPSAFLKLQGSTIDQSLENFRTYHSPLFSHGYQWFPNSAHIVKHDGGSITIREYDNTNVVTVYSGPFDPSFVYPWPNGSRLIILTNFNQGPIMPLNLYTIDLK